MSNFLDKENFLKFFSNFKINFIGFGNDKENSYFLKNTIKFFDYFFSNDKVLYKNTSSSYFSEDNFVLIISAIKKDFFNKIKKDKVINLENIEEKEKADFKINVIIFSLLFFLKNNYTYEDDFKNKIEKSFLYMIKKTNLSKLDYKNINFESFFGLNLVHLKQKSIIDFYNEESLVFNFLEQKMKNNYFKSITKEDLIVFNEFECFNLLKRKKSFMLDLFDFNNFPNVKKSTCVLFLNNLLEDKKILLDEGFIFKETEEKENFYKARTMVVLLYKWGFLEKTFSNFLLAEYYLTNLIKEQNYTSNHDLRFLNLFCGKNEDFYDVSDDKQGLFWNEYAFDLNNLLDKVKLEIDFLEKNNNNRLNDKVKQKILRF